MNTKELIALMQLTNGATVVAAKYLDSNANTTYHFKDVIGLDLAVDDIVVVETLNTFRLVRVCEVNVSYQSVGCGVSDLVHCVQRVDFSNLRRLRKAEEKAMAELALSELQERLNKMSEQIGANGFDRVRNLLTATTTAEAEVVESFSADGCNDAAQ